MKNDLLVIKIVGSIFSRLEPNPTLNSSNMSVMHLTFDRKILATEIHHEFAIEKFTLQKQLGRYVELLTNTREFDTLFLWNETMSLLSFDFSRLLNVLLPKIAELKENEGLL